MTALSRFIESCISGRDHPEEIACSRFIPPSPPVYSELQMDERVRRALGESGVERVYSHQAEAVRLLREGRNIVVMTPTASGKSLIYNIPVLEAALAAPGSKALYMSPLKGLEQDQMAALNRMAARLGLAGGAVYDGDTTPYRRKKIRENLPDVIFTNPDMLHLAINAFHPKWEPFFKNLKYVILDEIHAYRGVFGSHVAQVLRRLRRVAARWGSAPQFIACSATIANPAELAERLTGLSFSTVDNSGAPSGGRHFLFINPRSESPYTEAVRLFTKCLDEGLRTIVFTKSRKITELIYYWTVQARPAFEKRISPYRAGFLPEERREIERALFSGEPAGVVSTSALELGVDIGGLDVCIMAGYPGSVAGTWQRAGRAGRHGQESVVALIGLNDALDQYLMRHPESFFGKPHESVVVDEKNENILKAHLPCAAAEAALSENDPIYDQTVLKSCIGDLAAEGRLRAGKSGDLWYPAEQRPQRAVGIRAMGDPFLIVTRREKLGETGGLRLFRECFPGAIYLHRGRQFEIMETDYEDRKVFCRETDADYFTKALTEQDAEVTAEDAVRHETPLFSLHRGTVKLAYRVAGFEKRSLQDGRRYSVHTLQMPEYVFSTKGVWMKISDGLRDEIERTDLGGSLHAFEHAAISAMPLFSICDKTDIGGISYPHYPPFGRSAIFFYDGCEGGIGLTWKPFDSLREWLSAAREMVRSCPCESGCPSCVQDPQCGNGNRPLNKAGAVYLAERLLSVL